MAEPSCTGPDFERTRYVRTPYLCRLANESVTAIHPITQGEWAIGRDPHRCKIVVPAEFRAVGRVHARLLCDAAGSISLQDCHANGTFVNDERLANHDLRQMRPGDVITLAGVRASKPARCTYTLTDQPAELSCATTTNDLLSENAMILALMANPVGTSPLRLDEELRAIDQAILAAKYRDQLDLRQIGALRLSDLQAAVLRHAPSIVHFSGHGSTDGAIILSDDRGDAVTVPPTALTNFFRHVTPPLRCVVLNACFTRRQAKAIAAHVPCVIGMSRAVSDEAAIIFSVAFYQALAYGHSVRKGFDLAKNAIDIQRYSTAMGGRKEASTPVLLSRDGVAERLCFTYDRATRTA